MGWSPIPSCDHGGPGIRTSDECATTGEYLVSTVSVVAICPLDLEMKTRVKAYQSFF